MVALRLWADCCSVQWTTIREEGRSSECPRLYSCPEELQPARIAVHYLRFVAQLNLWGENQILRNTLGDFGKETIRA